MAKGVSYGIVGVLAVKLAAGDGGEATSRSGALHTLAHESFGRVVLILLVIGFAAYALWRVVQAFAMPADEGKDWLKRVGYLGRAAIYAGLTFSAVSILLGDGERLLENVGDLEVEQVRAVEAPGVTHIRYRVVR